MFTRYQLMKFNYLSLYVEDKPSFRLYSIHRL